MINRIIIDNFKLHNHTELQIGGLTILSGMNGMGKSSLIQSLLLLRQSFLMNDLEVGLNLKGDLCDLGMADELPCIVSKKTHLTIDINFLHQKSLNYSFLYGMNSTLLIREKDNAIDKEVLATYSLFNNNFQYLSAFRFGPQKSYGRDTSLVDIKRQLSKQAGQCEYTVHFLERYGKEELPIKALAIEDNNDYRLLNQVEQWLRKISPNIRITIEPQGQDLNLKYKFNRNENTITENFSTLNVGFGITYVLPILVAILSANKDALILIENPEAHIHPKGQAVLMELIAKAVANGVQVLIETHSDHIINGSLVAVKEEVISNEKLSVYYFERDEQQHTAIAHHLEVSKNGRIKRPPKGFFDQIDIDLRILTGF